MQKRIPVFLAIAVVTVSCVINLFVLVTEVGAVRPTEEPVLIFAYMYHGIPYYHCDWRVSDIWECWPISGYTHQ